MISLIAAGLSGVALLRSGSSEPETTTNPGGAQSAAAKPGNDAPPAQPTNETAPQASPTAALDVLNPQASFTVAYTVQELVPQVTRDDRAYIDLNEPRVVSSGGDTVDVSLSMPYNGSVPTIQLDDGVEAAITTTSNPNPQPEDCREAIRTSPVPPSAATAAQRPLVMCVATSAKQAASIGQAQLIVVIKVTALSEDGKVSMQLTAWKQPS
ncbi:hypothetical protein QEZ54_17500 [Catellatospora sp. KI3]|uniref:hypothetical protein n=1 Tax=Catellatospora sp. KI3 TaxID=3041620 RepID=UPI0024821F85|nr:hypothetical protein [Catellatospora sp. KI3]MDI1462774.1 hypothetical protein [Catellatospora sp. KI3]